MDGTRNLGLHFLISPELAKQARSIALATRAETTTGEPSGAKELLSANAVSTGFF